LHFTGFEAFGADVVLAFLALENNVDFLQIRKPFTLGVLHTVGYAHANLGLFTANDTLSAHNKCIIA
jgi:hypothetical protein